MNRYTKGLLITALLMCAVFAVVGCVDKSAQKEIGPLGVRERTAMNASEDSWVRSGADIIFYSDPNRVTETMRLEGATGALTAVTVTANAAYTTYTATDVDASGTITADKGVFTNTVSAAGVSSSGLMTATSGFVGNLTGNVTGDTAGTHTGAVIGNVTGNSATITQTATIGKFLRLPAQTAITVTNGAAFTPTGTIQPITAAGDVTPTITMGTAGDVVTLINTSDVAITFEGSATLAATIETDEDANINLGLNDTVTLWCSGSKWYSLADSNNTSE